MRQLLKSAFEATVPVLLGYLSIGIAFGLLISELGYNFLWAGFMSLVIYAGTMQYMMVNILGAGTGILETALITLTVHFRHMAYGLSFVQRFKTMGKKRFYMIFALTDETYALLCLAKTPKGVDPDKYIFAIALMNQSYWVLGSIIGAVAGSLITFDITGVDFAMTALFLVLCTEQWLSFPSRRPALTGIFCAVISLNIFGASNMLIPALLAVIAILLLNRKQIEKIISSSEEDIIIEKE